MKKITVIGSHNMDLVVRTPRLPKGGETIMGSEFHEIPGGKGANQAVAMARLGGKVTMIGLLGDDGFGESLVTSMKESGVLMDGVEKVENATTGIAVITLQDSAENSIIVIPGANRLVDPDYITANQDILMESDFVVMQLEIPLATVKSALKLSKKLGKQVIINPAPAQKLDDELYPLIDLLTPNETELEILSNMPVDTMENIKAAAKSLIDKGLNKIVVTLGSEGALYMDQNDLMIKVDAYKVKAIDTTAAGDSFTAAIAVGLSEDMSIQEMLRFACKVGALTVQKIGAQSSLPTRKEVTHFDFGE